MDLLTEIANSNARAMHRCLDPSASRRVTAIELILLHATPCDDDDRGSLIRPDRTVAARRGTTANYGIYQDAICEHSGGRRAACLKRGGDGGGVCESALG